MLIFNDARGATEMLRSVAIEQKKKMQDTLRLEFPDSTTPLKMMNAQFSRRHRKEGASA